MERIKIQLSAGKNPEKKVGLSFIPSGANLILSILGVFGKPLWLGFNRRRKGSDRFRIDRRRDAVEMGKIVATIREDCQTPWECLFVFFQGGVTPFSLVAKGANKKTAIIGVPLIWRTPTWFQRESNLGCMFALGRCKGWFLPSLDQPALLAFPTIFLSLHLLRKDLYPCSLLFASMPCPKQGFVEKIPPGRVEYTAVPPCANKYVSK